MWQIREMIALAMLAVCAYTDIKERNIYLVPLTISVSGAAMISLISFFTSSAGEGSGVLLKEIILPALVGLMVLVLAWIYRSHLGIGDAYLIAALGIITGIRCNLYTVICGLVIAFVFALVFMIIKKGRCRKSIPFAPFVMAGYMIVIINEI